MKNILPLVRELETKEPHLPIAWLGMGTAYRFVNGIWKRDEAYDYEFSVIQKRFENTWKSVKDMHRRHPEYDGRAGERDQTMYFEVAFQAPVNGEIPYRVSSSLGEGEGVFLDGGYRRSRLEISLRQTFFQRVVFPYNTLRITQHYQYEDGVLTETVELLKKTEGKEVPFMKMEERARFFIASELDGCPQIS
jgi:hypothetical protein